MGVTSSGKTSVGKAIARRLHAPFLDGDDYHPASNVTKMSAGTPLTDDDRWPWLQNFARSLHEAAEIKGSAVGACSALKRIYREFLVKNAGEPILFVYLDGSKDVIRERMKSRVGHFMPTTLLDSQFATLEVPTADENVLFAPIDQPVERIADLVVAELTHLRSFKRKQ
jgi:carbohydrate kinase (thermoresistant glucokinase family)